MRSYAFEIEKMRNEVSNIIVNFAKGYEFDGTHFLVLDEQVFLNPQDLLDVSVDNMVMTEDGDVIFYEGIEKLGSYLNYSTDVLAEVADQILNGRCRYVDEEEM
jgi:hypothetical protein